MGNYLSKTNSYHISRNISTMMKGIAIIFVILGHILNYCVGSSVVKVVGLLGTGGVWIFLILSGYGLYCSYIEKGLEVRSFWNNKINKVFVPYILVTFIYYIWLRLIGNAPDLMILLKNFLCIDFARNIDGTMWYMSFLLLWYIIFFVVFYFDYSVLMKTGVIFICAYIFSNEYYSAHFGDCNWQFVTNAYAFPIGILLGVVCNQLNRIQLEINFDRKQVLCVICGMSSLVYALGLFELLNLSYGQYGVLLFCIVYSMLCLLEMRQNIGFKVLELIGAYSFFLYLIEGKGMAILAQLRIENDIVYVISYCILMGILVIAYYVIKRLYKKMEEKGYAV